MAAPHPLFVLRGHRAPIHALCFRSAATNDKADAAAAGAALSSAASSQVIARPAASSAASRAVPLLSHAGPSSSLLCSGDAQGVVRVWNLATRRPTLTIDAHPGAPVLALVPLGSHSLLSQGKEGTIKLWDLQSSCTTPLRTLQTDSYTFFKMQLAPIPDAPLLLVPCETASNLALIDLRLPPSQNDGAVQLIECEKAIPRDPVVEDSLMSRMDEKDAREMQEMLASRPRQYERKVGIVMAAKFFDPKAEANSSKEEKHVMQSASSAAAASASIAAAAFPAPAASASSSSSSASSSSALPSLHVAWASEAGILGVWDIRASRQLFQHALHKDPILSFDLNWTGQRGVTVSAAKDVVQFNIDCNKLCVSELGRLTVPHDGLAEVCLRDDDRLFATAGWDHRVRLFSCEDMRPLAVLKEHTATVQCVAMTPRNERGVQEGIIASGSKDGKVAVYQLYPEQEAVQARLQSGSSASAKHAALFSSLHEGDGAAPKLLS